MTYEELRQQAEKKVQAKMAFFICAVIFFFTTISWLFLLFLASKGISDRKETFI